MYIVQGQSFLCVLTHTHTLIYSHTQTMRAGGRCFNIVCPARHMCVWEYVRCSPASFVLQSIDRTFLMYGNHRCRVVRYFKRSKCMWPIQQAISLRTRQRCVNSFQFAHVKVTKESTSFALLLHRGSSSSSLSSLLRRYTEKPPRNKKKVLTQSNPHTNK